MLIYRLADLMLEKQQHVLAVDDLFEDEQIGEFVKSIQIDSPYQQMLLEGVLTESVKENKLFVTFTVEGYFHYALGEVIYNQSTGRGSEFLQDIIENNKLNGAQEGVEQCLIRDVENDDLSRLIWLIVQGGTSLAVCSVPLAHAFLKVKGNQKTDDEVERAQRIQIRNVMDLLLAESTENDISVLEKALSHLEKTQKNSVVSYVYQQINSSVQPDNLKKASLYLKSLRFIPQSEMRPKLEYFETFNVEKKKSATYARYLEMLGRMFINDKIADYKKAITLLNEALEINLLRYPKSFGVVAINYSSIGLAYMSSGDYDKSINYYKKALNILLENNYRDLSSTYECLALAELQKKNFTSALDYFDKTLKIKEMNLGSKHSNVSSTLSAIALTYTNLGDSKNALKYWIKTLGIELNINNHRKEHNAILNKKIGDEYFKIQNYSSANKYLLDFWYYLKSINSMGEKFLKSTNKILKCYNFIGLEKYKSCNYSESINIYNSALDLMSGLKTSQFKIADVIYFNLGNAYYKNAQLKQAKFHLYQALKIRIKSIEKNPTPVGRSYICLGNVEVSLGNHKKAKEHYHKAHAIFLKALGVEHEHTKLMTKKLNELNDQ